ncbi:MAG: hypothetical protein LBR79_06410 [Oscillospiraceae bacterium]|nr:hypothetical protein [Oscillospiraceae bacterium]
MIISSPSPMARGKRRSLNYFETRLPHPGVGTMITYVTVFQLWFKLIGNIFPPRLYPGGK